MEKNVSVIDESGRIIGTTYPKRAKGLVKNGRARYVSCESEDTICLTCPPDKMEDKTMTDNSLNEALNDTRETVQNEQAVEKSERKPSAEYALYMLECIAKDTDAVKSAVMKASAVTDNGIKDIVEAREKTNRELVAFYIRMYDEFKPSAAVKKSNTVTRFEEIANMLKGLNRDDYDAEVWEAMMNAAQAQLTRNY